jgi:hypothetical protein
VSKIDFKITIHESLENTVCRSNESNGFTNMTHEHGHNIKEFRILDPTIKDDSKLTAPMIKSNLI